MGQDVGDLHGRLPHAKTRHGAEEVGGARTETRRPMAATVRRLRRLDRRVGPTRLVPRLVPVFLGRSA